MRNFRPATSSSARTTTSGQTATPARRRRRRRQKPSTPRLAVQRSLRTPPPKPTDFNDLHQLEGLDTVKTQIEAAAAPAETDDELFQRLAKLTPTDYDRVREDEADRAGVRVGTLDIEVVKRRPKDETADAIQGSKVSFPSIEPWTSPVNGAALLNEIVVTLERFVVAPKATIIAASLFTLHTYAFDLGASVFPWKGRPPIPRRWPNFRNFSRNGARGASGSQTHTEVCRLRAAIFQLLQAR